MQFFTVNHTKKLRTTILFLLILETVIPFVSVHASVGLLYFRAVAGPDFITLEWETAQELDNLGFNLYRGESNIFEDAQKLNNNLIPSQSGGSTGAFYEWPDNNVAVGTDYTYWLEDIDINGVSTVHDPVTASPTGGSSIPTVPSGGGNTNTNTPTPTPSQTPSPTAQVGTTSTPTNTPSRTPTTQPTSTNSNPTPTTALQPQPTSISNNEPAVTSPPAGTTTSETEQPEPVQVDPQEEGATPQLESISVDPQEEDISSVAAVQSGLTNETETSAAENSIGQQIGQSNLEDQLNSTSNNPSGNENSRSPIIIMALIVSVILLIAGGGGIIFLLQNRNKQSRT